MPLAIVDSTLSVKDASGTTVVMQASTSGGNTYPQSITALVKGFVSTLNSRNTLLGISGVFTGTLELVEDYAGLSVFIYTDQDSATNGLSLQFSIDGTNWDHVRTYSIAANTPYAIHLNTKAKYFRLVLTNGVVAQTLLRLQTILRTTSQGYDETLSGNVKFSLEEINTTIPVVTTEPKSATGTLSNVDASASNVTLLASNSSRLGATIFNDSTVNLYIKLGATSSLISFTVKILAGGYYEIPFRYNGRIDGIWDSATGTARVTELT